jgi:hypothetical protein
MKLLKNDWFNLAMVMATFFGTVAHYSVGVLIVFAYFVAWVYYKE